MIFNVYCIFECLINTRWLDTKKKIDLEESLIAWDEKKIVCTI